MSCNSVYGGEDEDEHHHKRLKKPRSNSNDSTASSGSTCCMKCQSMDKKSKKCPLLDLPHDIQINFLSYLHPRDILTFSCVDRQTHDMIHGGEEKKIPKEEKDNNGGGVSSLLWYHLFMRDYALVLHQWKYGVEAVNRSRHSNQPWNCPAPIASLLNYQYNPNYHHPSKYTDSKPSGPSMKEFYLKFTQTWLNYSIAGRTQNPTLVSIHGHVFDMTSFLDEHPGSPETIIMSGGGRDATSFFESVGHSKKARGLALDRLVEVVDQTCCGDGNGGEFSDWTEEGDDWIGSCGLICATDTATSNANTNANATRRNNLKQVGNVLPRRRSKPRTPGTLQTVRKQVQEEEEEALLELRRQVTTEMAKKGEMDIIGNVNVYFDPLCYAWKGWYINLDFEPVFVQRKNG